MAVFVLIWFALALGRAGASNLDDSSFLIQTHDASFLIQTRVPFEKPLESEPVPSMLKAMGGHTEEARLFRHKENRLEEQVSLAERKAEVARVHEKQARQADYERQQRKLTLERAVHADMLKRRQLAYEHEVAMREQKKQRKVQVKAKAEEVKAKAEVETRAAANDAAQENVTLLLRGTGRRPLKIKVLRSQRMGVVAEKGAAYFGLSDIQKVRLVYQGSPIKRADTVAAHNFKNGDFLDIWQAD